MPSLANVRFGILLTMNAEELHRVIHSDPEIMVALRLFGHSRAVTKLH
jgi:hypothetical protein